MYVVQIYLVTAFLLLSVTSPTGPFCLWRVPYLMPSMLACVGVYVWARV